ncbi:hypothetical protein TRVA0_002S02168 [Trichomonascus vanleenenianus]|uniref:Afg1p n=1 Tax=Trichomonascus vanleenenianus TaxID=2268995 RepID=UPI003EC9E8BB
MLRLAPTPAVLRGARVLKVSRRGYSASAASGRDPLAQYDFLVAQNRIRNDPYQRKVLSSLQHLHCDLLEYRPIEGTRKASFFSWLGSRNSRADEDKVGPQPNGIYLWGDVGCGKTMLMDMFYSTIPPHLTKRRVHFHAFIQDVHKRAYALKSKHGADFDVVPEIAHEIAIDANVLCFDEFQVIDVADAMILRRLLDLLLSPKHGVVIFYTSNRAPDGLYENGVQRDSFLPCIQKLKNTNEVVYLKSPTDYRKLDRPSKGTYFFPPEGESLDDVRAQAIHHADTWFLYFAQESTGNTRVEDHVEHHTHLSVWGRPVDIPKSVKDHVAQFTFTELCGKPLSAADYLEITKAFPCIVLTDIPMLSVRQVDVTRRFITFLDAAYESRTRLAVTAERPFEHLFNDAVPGLKKLDLKDLDPDSDIFSSDVFSGAEEKMAFARALSRLKQMASREWHEKPLHEQ